MKIFDHLSEKWAHRFIHLAEHVSTWSKDTHTKIGAVIITEQDKDVLSIGYNGLARGVDDSDPERSSRENGEKYFWYAHAERNAIYNAARKGRSLTGSTLVINKGIPCTGCAIAIIQSGIKRVICSHTQITGDKWGEEAIRSLAMFVEAEVGLWKYDPKEVE